MLASLPASAQKWVTVWAASPQGPYPAGNPSAQPNLRFAIPSPETGARDQTFRLIVLPELWGPEGRLRFSNVFGKKPLTLDTVCVGLQWGGATVAPGTTRCAFFGGKQSITIPAGESRWSDAVQMPAASYGRKLAVSFHVAGESGPITWHAKALQTSYVSVPGAGALSTSQHETAFPNTTTSWFFLDAVDMRAPSDTQVIVAFGDSITDGTSSTLNGDDRWPNLKKFWAKNPWGV